VRFEFIHAEKALYPLTVLCAVLSVSRSGYYRWMHRKPSMRERREQERRRQIRAIHIQSLGRYGSPRVWAVLRRMGEVITEKTVAKLMRKDGLFARPKRKHKVSTDSRKTERIAPNLLQRDFTATGPNQVWVTDVKAIWTLCGWCYLAAILDLFSRRVVGWAVSENNDTALALAALDRAIKSRRPPSGLIHHSDRGSPYGSDDYIAVLDAHGIVRSMSRKGDCWDNAVPESFFASVEHECLRLGTLANSVAASHAVEQYVDRFYNPERLHSTLDYLSPIEFELRSAFCHKAA
jgi:putative transposase